MTAKQSLYLRIPVSAFTAESRALNSAGGCHIRRIWHNDRRAGIISYTFLRPPQKAGRCIPPETHVNSPPVPAAARNNSANTETYLNKQHFFTR